MVEILKEYLDILASGEVDHTTQDSAEYLLGCCETWGMLAPEVENPSQDVIDNCLSANYWEDEDE